MFAEELATPPLDRDYVEHVHDYEKFVRLARLGAAAVPFFLVFVLYWTT
jgi:hypothetical protein